MIMFTNEIENFNKNNSLTVLPRQNKFLLYDIHLGNENPEKNYVELLNVIQCIISTPINDWFDDSEWRKKFSKEFNNHFPDLTREQCDEMLKGTSQKNWNKLPWDFGSWLDVIKKRSWIWCAHEKKGKFLHVALKIDDPNAGDLEALEELIKACGAKVVRSELMMR